MSDEEKVTRIETLTSHVWMVRTFLKHSEEGEEDDELQLVFRLLYDFALSLGDKINQPEVFLKQAKKKLPKLVEATELYLEIQPEISNHTNFQMAARSLQAAVEEIKSLLTTNAS